MRREDFKGLECLTLSMKDSDKPQYAANSVAHLNLCQYDARSLSFPLSHSLFFSFYSLPPYLCHCDALSLVHWQQVLGTMHGSFILHHVLFSTANVCVILPATIDFARDICWQFDYQFYLDYRMSKNYERLGMIDRNCSQGG